MEVFIILIFLILIGIVYYLYQMETMGATMRFNSTASSNTTTVSSASIEWVSKRLDSKTVLLMAEVSAVPTTGQTQCISTFALPSTISDFTSADGVMILAKGGQDASGTNIGTVNVDSISLVNHNVSVSFFSTSATTHTLTATILFYKL